MCLRTRSALPGHRARRRPGPATRGRLTTLPPPQVRVKVTVVDTGWWARAARHPWLAQDVDGDREVIGRNLHAYSGHGTFIAGIVRCRAPRPDLARAVRIQPRRAGRRTPTTRHPCVRRPSSGSSGRPLRRHEGDDRPHVINLSAGTYSLDDEELSTFQPSATRSATCPTPCSSRPPATTPPTSRSTRLPPTGPSVSGPWTAREASRTSPTTARRRCATRSDATM